MEDFKSWAIARVMEITKASDYLPLRIEMDGYASFDIVARRGKESIAIKIIYNVDTLKSDVAHDLKKISVRLEMIVVVIGARTGSGKLEDGVMYFRHQIPIMNMYTFREYMEGRKPIMYSGPGGYYIHINGKRMQDLRTQKGKSIGYLSGKIGISRRSISLYETGNSTTPEIFKKLNELLEDDISEKISIIDVCREWVSEFPEFGEAFTDIMGEVQETMNGIGFLTDFFRKSPFDAITEENKDAVYVMGISNGDIFDVKKINSLKNLCHILEKDPVLISTMNTTRDSLGGISLITLSELKTLSTPEQLKRRIESLKESSY